METKAEVAVAILYQDDRFLLQLRDDIPGIAYPGQWGFFGGHLEPGETPLLALGRELHEEIGYQPARLDRFLRMETEQVIRHVFHGPLLVTLAELVLQEGADLGLLSPIEIEQGWCYSHQVGKTCGIAAPHRQILLSFLQSLHMESSSG
ncbi:MAG: NUDIX hydrolase [Cyanobacteria bacterium REEB459]|nr:NUDIX hydrolase [Cyanobacteria bacterium REEB459]